MPPKHELSKENDMTKIHASLAAAVLGVFVAGSAFAQGAAGATTSDDHMTTSDDHMSTGATSTGAMSSGDHAGAMSTGAMSSGDHAGAMSTGAMASDHKMMAAHKTDKKMAAKPHKTGAMTSGAMPTGATSSPEH
jgi:hypothetical protein